MSGAHAPAGPHDVVGCVQRRAPAPAGLRSPDLRRRRLRRAPRRLWRQSLLRPVRRCGDVRGRRHAEPLRARHLRAEELPRARRELRLHFGRLLARARLRAVHAAGRLWQQRNPEPLRGPELHQARLPRELACGPSGDDRCGGILDCGTCALPLTCGGGTQPRRCGCTPKTCAQLGAACGATDDTCARSFRAGPVRRASAARGRNRTTAAAAPEWAIACVCRAAGAGRLRDRSRFRFRKSGARVPATSGSSTARARPRCGSAARRSSTTR